MPFGFGGELLLISLNFCMQALVEERGGTCAAGLYTLREQLMCVSVWLSVELRFTISENAAPEITSA